MKKGLNSVNSDCGEIIANTSYGSLNGEPEDINGHFNDNSIAEHDTT